MLLHSTSIMYLPTERSISSPLAAKSSKSLPFDVATTECSVPDRCRLRCELTIYLISISTTRYQSRISDTGERGEVHTCVRTTEHQRTTDNLHRRWRDSRNTLSSSNHPYRRNTTLRHTSDRPEACKLLKALLQHNIMDSAMPHT